MLFDRAEELAMRPQARGEEASVVLVLHGPEVEFFAISNYEKYKDIVDQAARLDAFDVVDVKICQSMMGAQGIERNDIPSFIEQVPLGPGEVERLVQQGYVDFWVCSRQVANRTYACCGIHGRTREQTRTGYFCVLPGYPGGLKLRIGANVICPASCLA